MFEKFVIETNTNLFNELSSATNFEDFANGRKGAVIVDCENELIPIVRTTTIYNNPAQKFLPVHRGIVNSIKKKINKNIAFNNALIELYDSNYRTMKFHTDQSLDLNDDSYICLFSCYDYIPNNTTDLRKLQIQNKTTSECSEILLDHNSIILFSVQTNHQYLHKIILESNIENKWLGITFRLSKTFIKHIDGVPYIYPTDKILRIANADEKKEFYKHKSNENLYNEYIYPEICYTISKSDLLPQFGNDVASSRYAQP